MVQEQGGGWSTYQPPVPPPVDEWVPPWVPPTMSALWPTYTPDEPAAATPSAPWTPPANRPPYQLYGAQMGNRPATPQDEVNLWQAQQAWAAAYPDAVAAAGPVTPAAAITPVTGYGSPGYQATAPGGRSGYQVYGYGGMGLPPQGEASASGIPAGVDPVWWEAFRAEHGGQTPTDYYKGNLEQALADRAWGEQFRAYNPLAKDWRGAIPRDVWDARYWLAKKTGVNPASLHPQDVEEYRQMGFPGAWRNSPWSAAGSAPAAVTAAGYQAPLNYWNMR